MTSLTSFTNHNNQRRYKRVGIQVEKFVLWVKHPQHCDPVKVKVPYHADIGDVKKAIKEELRPALDKESLGKVVILSPKIGKLNPRTLVRQVQLSKDENLIVYVDNVETRLFLKTLTSDRVPIQVNAPLCLKNDEAYLIVAKLFVGQAAPQEINILKDNLCPSSIESWSSVFTYPATKD
ncbi:1012_t:CDS:2 [Diversispora eburnea]|uniref:1012_t:CDS:1 n=1 Tax=Diversispora eburnea TaxID=1213867 RepID=A0A9N9BG58_9GLOM|nr:1012_t:CDS:2 [Diversispora eburnea]